MERLRTETYQLVRVRDGKRAMEKVGRREKVKVSGKLDVETSPSEIDRYNSFLDIGKL